MTKTARVLALVIGVLIGFLFLYAAMGEKLFYMFK